jgi:hypothetical protein
MSSALEAVCGEAALVISAAALVAGVLALVVTRRPGVGLSVLLDFLLAAGLLRLVGEPTWRSIASAAALVALRRLLGVGLRIGGRSWTRTAGAEGASAAWFITVRRLLRPAWRL